MAVCRIEKKMETSLADFLRDNFVGTHKMSEIIAGVQAFRPGVSVGKIRKAVSAVAVKNGDKRGATWTIT